MLDTPYDVRDEAMKDLVKAYDSNFEKQKSRQARGENTEGSHFEVKHRS